MNETELRALIREAVERHLGAARSGDRPPVPGPARRPSALPPRADAGSHPSQAIYLTLVGGGDACLIEPGAACSHCGYCKTHGY